MFIEQWVQHWTVIATSNMLNMFVLLISKLNHQFLSNNTENENQDSNLIFKIFALAKVEKTEANLNFLRVRKDTFS